MGDTVEETVRTPLTNASRRGARIPIPRGEGPFPAVPEQLRSLRRVGTRGEIRVARLPEVCRVRAELTACAGAQDVFRKNRHFDAPRDAPA